MTSKDYLSQEEIDALLRQSAEGNLAPSPKTVDDYLTPFEQDALGEIGNITFGSAATALSTLLGKKVDITTPKVSIITRGEFEEAFPKPHVAVHVQYVDGFQGINSLVIKIRDAQVIADLMLGGEGDPKDEELNEIHISAVQEAMNQMMGSSATSMSTIFNRFVNISPPGIDILNMSSGEGVGSLPDDETLIQISFRLKIGDLIDSTIMQLLPVQFAKDMVTMLLGDVSQADQEAAVSSAEATPPPAAAAAPAPAPEPAQAPPTAQQQMPAPEAGGYPPQYPPQGQGMPPYPGMPEGGYYYPPAGMPAYGMQGMPPYGMPPQGTPYPQAQPQNPAQGRNVNVQPVQFANLSAGAFGNIDENNLNLLMDIPLKVTVELGRTQKQIKDILEMSQGSIIELDKLAGEPVDILVNNKLIAKGEVVVIDENFGVRVTDIVSQWDRIQKLQ
ncbi:MULTISPECIES: flagellar motor switch phosphatase FliY [Paenibacillus]|uniref:Flagellar motor switch protein FliN/FliY n=1 Tax=Paenibacillus silagei TaxID=1670801 RepID=A0ABS4P2H0_9BACL|nr:MULTISPECIES: flagellar motor switch phosphatase FliY [Paenibacillus]ETT73899.1 flagellar motor switch protein fliN [Paenibacillus sp. FSL R7-277]MBP2115884.1 flagellar motor switch protein FliN/FliY [Paenibacillus silagei]